MNPRQLATVAFAIVGIVVILVSLPGVIQRMMEAEWSRAGWSVLVVVPLMSAGILIAAWLVFGGSRLARRLFPAEEVPLIQLSAHDLLSAGLLLLGVVLVTVGITTLLRVDHFSRHRLLPDNEMNWEGMAHIFWFGTGAVLILAPNFVARILLRQALNQPNGHPEGQDARR